MLHSIRFERSLLSPDKVTAVIVNSSLEQVAKDKSLLQPSRLSDHFLPSTQSPTSSLGEADH